ncbi:UBX domain-containing protein 2A isoform X2 [Sturnira hondurensis]|uniref:UBX domain-containing protein 2A isoform X2 n=1 Tax=Sturnira hondurensis TaxID=192404 RepID=UPI00187A3ED5|nr:UBX domain-containing protein 2A isoform X2 [Sturnira hondurensis]
MKEADNLESIKEEWVCETGSDNRPVSDNQQTTCEYFVDSLFEEAQKVGAKRSSPAEQKKKVDVSIKLWKNGFTVNDDFRSYSEGASQQFLNSIKKGELPLELEGAFDKEEVDVQVEDKKHEVCVSTKPVFQPFSGQGHRLGSATPKIISKAKSIEVEKKSGLSLVPLNHLEPTTNVQIWLASGKRVVQKFNVSHSCLCLVSARKPANRCQVNRKHPRDSTRALSERNPVSPTQLMIQRVGTRWKHVCTNDRM